MTKGIERFLDDESRLVTWPAKHAMKDLACAYLAGKFAFGLVYRESEVNEIIASWHTFADHFLLRRALVDRKYLLRTPDGRQYWKNQDKQPEAAPADPRGD